MRTLVGTVGQSVLVTDDGERWSRVGPNVGFHSDGIVRTLANSPEAPHSVWAGTDQGILRSDDGGRTWRRLEGALTGQQVWRITFHPTTPSVVYAGTGTPSRAGIYRSEDDGATWEQLPVEIAETCAAVGVPRITDIAVDPLEPLKLWASIEVDGLRRSADGGKTWTRIDGPITNPDGHAASVTSGPPKSVCLTVNNEIYFSRDDGVTWQAVGVREHFPYAHTRDVVFDAVDPCTAWAAIGDATQGTNRSAHADPRYWRDLAARGYARAAELGDVGGQDPGRHARAGVGRQPLRLRVREPGSRRELPQAGAGVQRGVSHRVGTGVIQMGLAIASNRTPRTAYPDRAKPSSR